MSRDEQLNGYFGEVCAARHLRDHGFEILTANYHTRFGELDIVARKKNTLVFAEVKTRGAHALALPAESVGRDKQRRLSLAATQYMQQRDLHLHARFDVIEVYLDERGGLREVRHLEDAFDSRI